MAEEVKVSTVEEILENTTIADVYKAAKQLDGVAKKTKLIESPFFSDLCGNNVYLKPENLQNTGSFKLRGAYNKISQLSDEEKKIGVITASAGNHAQGVAFAAQRLGVNAVICMPATTPLLKVEATKAMGAEVVLHGDSFDDAYAKSLELQKKKGYVYIHPFNDKQVLGHGRYIVHLCILRFYKLLFTTFCSFFADDTCTRNCVQNYEKYLVFGTKKG